MADARRDRMILRSKICTEVVYCNTLPYRSYKSVCNGPLIWLSLPFESNSCKFDPSKDLAFSNAHLHHADVLSFGLEGVVIAWFYAEVYWKLFQLETSTLPIPNFESCLELFPFIERNVGKTQNGTSLHRAEPVNMHDVWACSWNLQIWKKNLRQLIYSSVCGYVIGILRHGTKPSISREPS